MQKLKLIKNWVYDPQEQSKYKDGPGHFALAKINRLKGTVTSRITSDEDLAEHYHNTTWFGCREEGHRVWTEKCHSIIFCHEGEQAELISEFINKIERILKIPAKEQTILFSTDRTTMSAVKSSDFWVSCPMRRQIFSILLRAGRNHVIGDEVGTALSITKYTQLTKNAIELFLQGYNKFTKSCLDDLVEDFHCGFIHQFSNKSLEDCKLLMKNK